MFTLIKKILRLAFLATALAGVTACAVPGKAPHMVDYSYAPAKSVFTADDLTIADY